MLKTKFKFSDFHRDIETVYPWRLSNLFCNITARCNQACLYCHSPLEASAAKEMPVSLIRRIADQSAQTGIRNFVLTGGEPTLHSRFQEILELLAGYPFDVKMATNGFSLDKGMLDLLAANNVKSLQISVDTLDPGHYRAIKRNDNLPALLENVRRAVAGGRLHVAVSSVANTIVAGDLEEILRFCCREGVHTFTVMRPTPINTGALNRDITLPEEVFIETMDRLIGVFYECAADGLLELGYPYAGNSPLYRKWSAMVDINLTQCEGGRNALTISSDGRVSPCICLETDEFYFGDVTRSHIKDLWNDPFLDLFRGRGRYDGCGGCPDFADCLGGCRALAFVETGNSNGRDPFCVYWK